MASVVGKSRKLQALKEAIDEGMADVEAGRVVPWDLKEFLKHYIKEKKGKVLENVLFRGLPANKKKGPKIRAKVRRSI